jgi:phosphomannomutase/phosphoglucomutase
MPPFARPATGTGDSNPEALCPVDEETPMLTGKAYPAIKGCDIRGRYPAEVNEALFDLVGCNFGRQVREAEFEGWEHPIVIVGGDGRRSTASLKGRILSALAGQGCAAISLPVATPTPIAYWAKNRRKAQAVAVITASHSPADWNGLKVMNGPLPPVPDDISALARPLDSRGASGAVGRAVDDDRAVEDYLLERRQAFQGQGIERLPVAIDPGSGCQAGVASRLFRALGARVTAIHDELDGAFLRRHPDCAVPGHLAALGEAVRQAGAAVGIAFDGDGDRLALVDEMGRPLSAEQVAMLLLTRAVPVPKGAPVILDIKSSMHVERLVREVGGLPIRCKSGHAFIKRAVLEQDAVMGSEVTGHLYLQDLEGIDDPLYTALLFCRWLAGERTALSALVDGLPLFHVSPDIRLPMPAENIAALQERLLTKVPATEIDRTDGVRLVWPEGWLLARCSVMEQAVTLRFEGGEAEDLTAVVERFLGVFPELRARVSEALARHAR